MLHSRCLSSASRRHVARVVLCVAAVVFLCPMALLAAPSASYYSDGVDVYDDWSICRTNGDGNDGFFRRIGDRFEPVIAAESLGGNTQRAYVLGMQFAEEYPSVTQRAEAVFAYARDRVQYTSDYSQFGYPEFAQNADELADVLEKDGMAYGDCEDYAVLLGVMYLGAGLRSAVVLAPEHAAALVYLPGYSKANVFLTVAGDRGWVWAEATGGTNPLGWAPEEFLNERLLAYELANEGLAPGKPPDLPQVSLTRDAGGNVELPGSSFFLVLFILWALSRLFRRRAASW